MMKIYAFQKTVLYPIAVAALVLAGHLLALDILTYALVAAVGLFTLVFNDDGLPFVVPLFYVVFTVSLKNSPAFDKSYYSSTAFAASVAVIGAFLVAGFVFRFLYYKQWRGLFSRTRLTYGFIALSFGLLMNGVFFKGYTPKNLVLGLGYVLCFFFVYQFLFCSVKWDKKTSLPYVARVCAVAAVLIAVQLAERYLTCPELRETLDKGLINTGWAMSNHIGATLFLMLPFCLYLVHTDRRPWIYYAICLAILAAIIFTFSRSTLLFSIPVFVAGVIYSCIDGKKRLQILAISGACALAAVIVFLIYRQPIMDKLRFYIEVGLDDRGRFELWKGGLKTFLKAPIFGVGIMHRYKEMFFSFTFYHNTPLQYLVMGGVVGLFGYAFHRVQTVTLFVRKLNVDRLFLGVALFGILGISLLDNPMMNQYTLFYYSAILVLAERDLDYTLQSVKPLFSSDRTPLPEPSSAPGLDKPQEDKQPPVPADSSPEMETPPQDTRQNQSEP